MRIAKYISNAGYCSRREAEKLIDQQKVYINNICCNHPSTLVNEKDKIVIQNQIIKLQKKVRLWKMYKPKKTICTNSDPQNRKTIFSLIPKNYPRMISIGRLDFMSEGLMLLTNNGEMARNYELPSSNIIRIYRVCIRGVIDSKDLTIINKGVTINKINYKKIKVKIEKIGTPYTWLIFKMTEGKNREIRKLCDYFLWNIVNLVRIQYGSIKLKDLKPGEVVEVKKFRTLI